MCSITRRSFLRDSMLAVAAADSSRSAWAQGGPLPPAARSARQSITVGVVQQAREPELAANRDKIVRFIGQAKARGCRLVIFPEDALGSPVGTSNEDIEKAVDAIRDAARSNDVYAIFCSSFAIPGFAPDRRGHCLRVVGPDGRILLALQQADLQSPAVGPAPGAGRLPRGRHSVLRHDLCGSLAAGFRGTPRHPGSEDSH